MPWAPLALPVRVAATAWSWNGFACERAVCVDRPVQGLVVGPPTQTKPLRLPLVLPDVPPQEELRVQLLPGERLQSSVMRGHIGPEPNLYRPAFVLEVVDAPINVALGCPHNAVVGGDVASESDVKVSDQRTGDSLHVFSRNPPHVSTAGHVGIPAIASANKVHDGVAPVVPLLPAADRVGDRELEEVSDWGRPSCTLLADAIAGDADVPRGRHVTESSEYVYVEIAGSLVADLNVPIRMLRHHRLQRCGQPRATLIGALPNEKAGR